jgi:hypothetical protein
MKRYLLSSLLAGWGVLLAGVAPGEEPGQPQPVPAAPAEGPGCHGPGCHEPERSATVSRVHIVERQEATTAPEYKLRDEVCRTTVPGLEVDYHEERRIVADVELRPHVSEQQVTCYTTRLVEEIDPCTGKACLVHKQVPEVRTVKVTCYETVPVQRIVVVRVPVLKEVPRPVAVHRLALDVNTVPAIRKTYEGIFLEEKVAVPPPAPVPPLPCLK